MPNTGRPSRDCHLCRKRRVKCDLGRPACQRCIKYGAECPGYRDQQELVFRNADPTTVKKRKKKGDTAGSSQDTSPSQTAIQTPTLVPGGDFLFTTLADEDVDYKAKQNASMALTRPLYEHWTSHSVPMIVNVYSNLDFIKNIYRRNQDNGPLTWAAHLFTRTYVTNIRYPTAIDRDSHIETQRELGHYLGKTLSSVSSALSTHEGTLRDDVLATVWILANYELLVGSLQRIEPLSPWHLHAKGLYSILKARGTAPLYTDAGRVAFWPAYNMVQIQALVSNMACPPESEEWFEIIKNSLYPGEALTLYVSIFISQISSIQARILNILRRHDFPSASSEYPTLFAQLMAAEKEVEDWLAENPMGDGIDVYMVNMKNSALVKGYHTMQLLINFLTHYAACPTPLEDLRENRKYCLQTVQASAQNIIENVPLAIGPLTKGKDKSPRVLFDALKLTWPLISVFVVASCRPEQRLAAEGILLYIGKELGVRQALNSYSSDRFLPLEAQEPLGEPPVAYGRSACFH